MKPEKIVILNNRQEKLVGYLYKGTSKTIIIVCHGLESINNSPEPYFQKIVPEYFSDINKRTDASIFSFDFSGYGESEGKYSLSLRQHDDEIKTVIDYFSPEYGKIILYGYSLGGLSAAIASLHYKNVAGLIAINGFFTLNLSNLYRSNVSIILSYLLSHPSFGLELYYRRKELKIQNITVPALVVYGDNDSFVKSKQSITFFEKLRTKKKIFTIESSDHGLRKEYMLIPPVIEQWMKEEKLG